MHIPKKIAAACSDRAERKRWLAALPEILRTVQHRWSLALGPPFEGDEVSCAWVAPATLDNQANAILKLSMPHMEGEHEIEGLRFWDGDPTVHLLAADDELGALLLERCEPGTHLRTLPEADQDLVLASLLPRLWRSTPPHLPFRPLSQMLFCWRDAVLSRRENWKDAGLVAQGLKCFEELSSASPDDVLLATDLHAGNVLRAEREPWLVIDPKPFVGDRTYDATQHLLNCYTRLLAEPEKTIGRFADLLELDSERVRLWIFARAAASAGESPEDERWLALARSLG